MEHPTWKSHGNEAVSGIRFWRKVDMKMIQQLSYRAFSQDVTGALLVFQNKEIAAMMGYQTNPPRIELYFNASTFFCLSNPIWLQVT